MRLDTFSAKQRQIFDFIRSDDNYLICDGAVRSGKTVCMTVAFILWAMLFQDGACFAICGKTVGSAERNIITPLLNIDGIGHKCKYHRSEHFLECRINGRSNRFYVFGGRDESSYMLLQGMTLAGVLMDEVALMPRSFVEQAMARTLTYARKKIWCNCNPENRMHWFNQEWIMPADEGEKASIKHLHFLMSDNPIMGETEIAAAEEMFSGVFYQRYILGLWVMAEGLIYDMFDETIHVLREEPKTEGDYYVSSDFGIQNATVFLLWRKEAGTNRWICLNEYYYSGRDNQRQKTVSELVDGLESLLPEGVEPKQIIVDPSATALITEIRRRRHHVLPADNDVLAGISDVSTMLRQSRLAFMSRCKNTINEFGVYCWDKKASDRGEDKPVKDNDHCLTGDTMVMTEHGNVAIRDLCGKRGKVWSYNTKTGKRELRRFHKVRKTGEAKPVYKLTLKDGTVIRGTSDHPVLTDEGYRTILSMAYRFHTWRVVIADGYCARLLTVTSLDFDGYEDVYNMEVRHNHNFCVNGGAVVHNCMDAARYFIKTKRLVKKTSAGNYNFFTR